MVGSRVSCNDKEVASACILVRDDTVLDDKVLGDKARDDKVLDHKMALGDKVLVHTDLGDTVQADKYLGGMVLGHMMVPVGKELGHTMFLGGTVLELDDMALVDREAHTMTLDYG